MRQENTGNAITAVKYLKDRVAIYFGKTKVELSPDLFSSSYYYVGKVISDQELEKLMIDVQVDFALKYAKSLLAKKEMSEWDVRNKLYDKEFTKDIVDLAIKKLKKEKLIDDKRLAKEIVQYLNEKLYGKNRIIQELRLRGIFDETIQLIKFSEASELKKAKKILPKFEKQYADLNNVEKKQHIYNALIRYGYSNDIALEVTKKIKNNSPVRESNQLRRDFAVAIDKGMRQYKTEDGLKAYVFRTLSAKGYKMSDIRNVWENNKK